MSERHGGFVKELGFADTHTLYSWKHTEVVNAYNVGVDINSLHRQYQHSSIDMTDKLPGIT